MTKRIGHLIWRGFIFSATACVLIPAGIIILGFPLTVFTAPILAEAIFRFYYIYARVPSTFLTYPDVSDKLGIPQTAFGIGFTFLCWMAVALVFGVVYALMHRLATTMRIHSHYEIET